MSEENVEIVRGAIDAWNRQDVDGILAVTKPEAEYVNAPEAVEPGTRRGHDEMVAVVRTQWEALGPGARQEIDRLHDRGDEIISQVRASRTMPGGVDRIEIRILASWQIRDGKVRRVEILGAGSAFQKALEAVGLSEQAMSEENVEIVRQVYESLSRGDRAWRDLVAPDVVVDFSRRRIDPFVARGLDDPVLVSLESAALEIWEEPPVWEPEELIEAGSSVFAFIRTSARGKESGALVEARVANVWTFRDGKPVALTYFGEDRRAALEAAGLSA